MRVLILILFLACSDSDKVYLCNGPSSVAYHKTKKCQGLRRCSTEIETTDLATAKKEREENAGIVIEMFKPFSSEIIGHFMSTCSYKKPAATTIV